MSSNLASRNNEKPTSGLDWPLLITYLLFCIGGLICIYSAIYSADHSSIFDYKVSHGKQLIYIGISLVLGMIIMISDYEVWPAFAYFLYGIIMVLCVLVIFISPEVKGAHSWLQIGGFRFQPSEFGKLATALALSKYLSGYDIKFSDNRTKLICFGFILLPLIITLLQNDTGSALVYSSFIFMLFREGLSGYLLIAGFAAIVAAVLGLLINPVYIIFSVVSFTTLVVIAFFFIFRRNYLLIYTALISCAIICASCFFSNFAFNHLQQHQKERIMVLFGQKVDLKGAGYNVHQSKIAIGSGGLLGKGFLQGTQTKFNFVPEQSTDFIFCTVGEEWGFAGTLTLVAAYVWMLCRMIFIAERQRNKFNRVFIYSVSSIFFFHFMVNIGMTIGLLPVIGIPLPFFSYGGSGMLSFSLMMFVLLKIDSNRVNELVTMLD